MKEERGSVTLWILGLCLAILMLGGVALDLWWGVAVRRELAAVADAAAASAATAIDEAAWRSEGRLKIDPGRAWNQVLRLVAAHPSGEALARPPAVAVAADGSAVTVAVEGWVEWGLLRLVAPGEEGAVVRATAVAEPRLIG